MKNRKSFPLFIYLIILAVALTWISGMFNQGGNALPYSQVVSLFRQEQVKSFTVQKNTIYLSLHTPYEGETEVATALANPERPLLALTAIPLRVAVSVCLHSVRVDLT